MIRLIKASRIWGAATKASRTRQADIGQVDLIQLTFNHIFIFISQSLVNNLI